MQRFRSKQYPRSGNKLAVLQEFAFRYYLYVVVIFCAITLYQLYKGEVKAIQLMMAFIPCILLCNYLASVNMKGTWAELYFVGDTFTLLSVHDVLNTDATAQRSFPIAMSNPNEQKRELHITYGDFIARLDPDDWEDFDAMKARFQFG